MKKMKSRKITAGLTALVLVGSTMSASAQWGGQRNPYGYYGGGHGYRTMAYGGYPYGGYYRRNNNWGGGALIAGLVGSAILGGLLNAALPIGAFGGGFGYPSYGSPYGAYDPYGYGYQPGYPPYPIVYRPVRQRVVYVQRQPRYQRVHMRVGSPSVRVGYR